MKKKRFYVILITANIIILFLIMFFLNLQVNDPDSDFRKSVVDSCYNKIKNLLEIETYTNAPIGNYILLGPSQFEENKK